MKTGNYLKIIQKIPGNYESKELQKTAILSTRHIFHKVLLYKDKTFDCEKTLHIPYIVTTKWLQHYVFYNRGFRYIFANTMLKFDDDDDDKGREFEKL
jgi:hypothetical protein